MKTLIVDDDSTNRLLLEQLLKSFGPIHFAVNGLEAVEAVKIGLENNYIYDLICLDVMMPVMDGVTALEKIRELEDKAKLFAPDNIKIIMITAKSDLITIKDAYTGFCDAYLVKPILKARLLEELKKLKLISQ